MPKTNKLLTLAVATAIAGTTMLGVTSAYDVTYHPEANVSYTLNSGFDTKREFTAGLITITDSNETYTIMDRNLGATSTGVDSSDSYGYYFQWGNNYGFPSDPNASIATGSTQVDASGYGPGHYYSSSTFITRRTTSWDRSSVQNDNLRGGVSGTYEAMQGPCPDGFHVPSSEEWLGLSTMLGYDGSYDGEGSFQAVNSLKTELYIPFVGHRDRSSAGVNLQGIYAFYWSSTAYSADRAYHLLFDSSGLSPQNDNHRSNGLSVRCFRNSPYSTSDLPSEGGDGLITVNIAALNGGQNTCTLDNYIFSGIFASPSVVFKNISQSMHCIFGDAGSKAVTLELSGNLTDGSGNIIPGGNVRLKNSAWIATPSGIQTGNTAIAEYTGLNQTITLFNKVANKIGEATGAGVDIQIEVPGGTPNGVYNGVLVLSY